jgi:hypothetical protein
VAAVDDRAVEAIRPEALLDDYPAATRATVDTLRALVREAVPDAWERVRVGWRLIGYDLPLRRYGVYFAYIAPELAHVHIGFEWGGFMADPAGAAPGRRRDEAGPMADVRGAGRDRSGRRRPS